jgi:hypothetical protein
MLANGDSGFVTLESSPGDVSDLPPDGPAITITLIGADANFEIVAGISYQSETTFISAELCSQLRLVPMVLAAESKKKYSAQGHDGKVLEATATARMLRFEIGGHRFAIRPVLVVRNLPHPTTRIQLGKDFLKVTSGELRISLPHGYVNITADGGDRPIGEDGPRLLRFRTETGEGAVIDLEPERLSRVEASIARLTAAAEARTDTCSQCGVRANGLKTCARCKRVRFCGQLCQVSNWPAHKSDCKRWTAELIASKGSS